MLLIPLACAKQVLGYPKSNSVNKEDDEMLSLLGERHDAKAKAQGLSCPCNLCMFNDKLQNARGQCYRIMVVSKAWACAAREALEACALIETAKNGGGRPLAHATDLVACQAYELCGPSFVTTLPDGKPATPCTAFHSSRPCSPPDRACCIPQAGCASPTRTTIRCASSPARERHAACWRCPTHRPAS